MTIVHFYATDKVHLNLCESHKFQGISLMQKGMTILLFLCCTSMAKAQSQLLDSISNTVEKICLKPDGAAEYWNVKVRSDGSAGIGLKQLGLPGIKASGDVEFTKSEWSNIVSSIENNQDYRQCAKEVTAIFASKFIPALQAEKQAQKEAKNKAILGGVAFSEIGFGVEMTLNSCDRKGSSVVCNLLLEALDTDCEFRINRAYLYDQIGRVHKATASTIANFKGTPRVDVQLISGVQTKFILEFGNVKIDSTKISKLEVESYVCRQKNHTYPFRGIDIQ